MTNDNCLFCKYSILSTKHLAQIRLDQNSEQKIPITCTNPENDHCHPAPIGPPEYKNIPIIQITGGTCSMFEATATETYDKA